MRRLSQPFQPFVPAQRAAATPRSVPCGVDALWAACLQIAAARREGVAARMPSLPPGSLVRDAQGQWQLDGPSDAAALALFRLFKPLLDCTTSVHPWVVAQLGQSLDGFIATRTGDSHFVNGPENLLHLHRLRALSDAVIVGAGTVAIDNPQLTTRRVPGPNPVRVVFDPALQLAPCVQKAQLFHDQQAPTLWLCDARWQDEATRLADAAQVLAVPGLVGDDGMPVVAKALAALHARGLKLLFVEGGGVTVSAFWAQGCLDRLHLAVAPLIIGNGRPGLRFAGAEVLGECARPAFNVVPMGQDQLWDLDLSPLRAAP
jgi:diaminohydroxyphosphoribosylaminopyrimidine deaminase / 5-amino-6-(5-phosphoribosylamino)uracil reductase